jgi:flotillin
MEAIVVLVVCLALAAVAAVVIVQKLICICQPSEVLVFSGSRRRSGGREVGYRLVQGGRGIRIPLLEKVGRLDLTNMIIDVRVNAAYSKGGIPLNVAAVANVKVASHEPIIQNAIERFLGKHREEIVQVAKETLEGNLRGVLATLTPEEVNNDRVKFAQSLLHEAESDLKKLGLLLDTLKIQHVTDDRGYLDSIGRKQSADLVMRSRVAEAENTALAAERDAENYQTRAFARIDAEMAMATADASRRIVDAKTKKDAMVAEQRSEVTALIARSRAEVEVQTERLEQVRLRLEADRIEPADAARRQLIASARGAVAGIVEEGKASAASLRAMSASWNAAGDDAARVYVAQRLGGLVRQMLSTTTDINIDKVTVIDRRVSERGDLGTRAAVASSVLKESVGLDVPQVLKSVAAISAFGTTPER